MSELRVLLFRPCPAAEARLPWWGSLFWAGPRVRIAADPDVWFWPVRPAPGGANLLAKS